MNQNEDPFEPVQFCELCKTRKASIIPLRSGGVKPVRKLICVKCAGLLKRMKYARFVVNHRNRHLSFYLLLAQQHKTSKHDKPREIVLDADQVTLLRARGFRVDKMEGA